MSKARLFGIPKDLEYPANLLYAIGVNFNDEHLPVNRSLYQFMTSDEMEKILSDNLKEFQKRVIKLRYEKLLCYKQIADALNTYAGAIKKIEGQSLYKLRFCIEQNT